jgi:5-methyltetrahydrofolate--homocysteine methyltransferase
MNSNRFLEPLQAGKMLVLDGVTGANRLRRGLPTGMPSDVWVLDNPEAVMQLHRDFLEAGSDIPLTDTFGSTRLHLGHAALTDRFEQTNRRAVELVRQVVAGTGALVGGCCGTSPEHLKAITQAVRVL